MTVPTAEVGSPPTSAGRRALAFGLMTASGFAALGYQIVWTQQATLWLGHESAAVLAVVAAFFGGLALGALALGGRIARSRRPVVWYAGCEAVVAVWAATLLGVMPWASGVLLALIGARPSAALQWSVAFGGTFALLLPATAALGATLPAMERVVGGLSRRAGASLAGLYAANTGGAVLGVLATAFWLLPAIGLVRTSAACILLNLGCAALAWGWRGGALAVDAPPGASSPASGALWRLAATGALGIGYEVLVVWVLSQVAENTVYTYALLLAVYLVGSALGAAAFQRWIDRGVDSVALRDRLLLALAAACLLGTASLWGADALQAAVRRALGPGMGAALAGEAAIAVAAFLLPSAAMGALFSQLATDARRHGIALGRSLGVNTLGAAVAPLVFGVLAVPSVGPKVALLGIAAGYLALTSWQRLASLPVLGTAAAALALGLLAPPLAFVDVPEGGRLVSYRDGTAAAVSVVEDANGVSRLRIDNRAQEGDSASRPADARQALLPLLLHPAPRRALFLGLGTGVTAASAAADPSLQVDAVELLPDVIAASTGFTRRIDGALRLQTIAADARRYVRTATTHYDVIVADNFHPARSGSGALYTVEHFAAVRQRLAPGGVFCQWLPLHQLDLTTLRSIVKSFLAVYPDGAALLATNSLETPVLGLVGRAGATRFDAAVVRERLDRAAPALLSGEFGLVDEFAVLGSFVAGPRSLAAFAAPAELNTDDRPVVAYRAPRITYAPAALPRDRLLELVHLLGVDPGEIDTAAPGTDAALRLAAYRAARDRFLEVGRGVQPSRDVRRMLAQVRGPLLGVLQLSADFRPAYDPLLQMAAALAARDPAAARGLLEALARVQPTRPEAAEALRRIDAPEPP